MVMRYVILSSIIICLISISLLLTGLIIEFISNEDIVPEYPIGAPTPLQNYIFVTSALGILCSIVILLSSRGSGDDDS